MNQPTKMSPEAVAQFEHSSLFPCFLADGLNYIDAFTPTLINAGGCGVFANLLGKELTKIGIAYKFIGISQNDEVSTKDMQDFLDNMADAKKDMNISHILVEIDGLFYCDCTGIVNKDYYTATGTVEISQAQLEALLHRKETWNIIFDRDCTPFIQEKLDYIFDHMLEYHAAYFDFTGARDVKINEKTVKNKRKATGSGFPSFLSHFM